MNVKSVNVTFSVVGGKKSEPQHSLPVKRGIVLCGSAIEPNMCCVNTPSGGHP